jgi:hypothetical protein
MAEEYSKKSKRPPPKGKMKKMYKEEVEEDEVMDDIFSGTEQQLQESYSMKQQIPPPPPPLPKQFAAKKAARPKKEEREFDNESPSPVQTKYASVPTKMPSQKMAKSHIFAEKQYQAQLQMLPDDAEIFPEVYTPLPPITSTQNFYEIFQTANQLQSIKAFRVSI